MPRANFECKKCAKTNNVGEVVYEDLPVECQRCPVCGAKRGFKRLFDAINVSAEAHGKRLLVDRLVEPQYEAFMERRESTKRIEAEQRKVGAAAEQMRIPVNQLIQSTGAHLASQQLGVPVLNRLQGRRPTPNVSAAHWPKK